MEGGVLGAVEPVGNVGVEGGKAGAHGGEGGAYVEVGSAESGEGWGVGGGDVEGGSGAVYTLADGPGAECVFKS